jgi:hypothetical protein
MKAYAETIHASDWDWGAKSNQKLRKIFKIKDDERLDSNESLDDFIEFLLNEIDTQELVSHFLYYAPMKAIASEADLYGYMENIK